MVSEEFPAEAGTLPAGFAPGSRIAGYKLEEQIGAGGMAVVFRARDERLQRQVALKILSPALEADEAFRHRFIRESRAAAAVDDPHIIPVFEAGEADGVLFIAMRYVPGGDVQTLVRRTGPLSPVRALAIISPVASALDTAHGAGLVHRDVKSANMLVDARPGRPDHVYLSDFGLSKGVLNSAGPTLTGQFLGTPAYSAPEQIAGKPVDGRADQYSLACAAFELLCGETPFPRDQVTAMIWAHMSEAPPALTSRRPGLPPAVDGVLARALAKQPEDRYASCREFADLLRAALGLAPYDPGSVGVREAGNPDPAPAPAQPPPTVSILERPRQEPAIEARSGSETTVVGNRPDAPAGQPPDNAIAPADVIAAPLPGPPSPGPGPGIGPDPDAIPGQPTRHDERNLAGPGRRRVLVGLAGTAAIAAVAAAGWEIRHLMHGSTPVTKSTAPAPARTVRAGTLVWRFAAGAGIGSRPAISAGVVYFGSNDSKVYALDARQGTMLWSFPTGGQVESSPAVVDGVVYFGSEDNNVYAVDARHGTMLWKFPTGGPVESSPAVVDGVVYIGSQDWNIYALSAGKGTQLWKVPTGGPIDSSPAVSGGTAYIGSGDGSIYAVSAGGTKLPSFATTGFVDSSPAITDGTVYAASNDGYVYALNAGKLADVIWSYETGGPVPFSSPAVSGGVVYIGSHDDNVYALTADRGSKLWSFSTLGAVDSSPAVAAGVVYIGSDDQNLYALGADNGKELWSFPTSGHVFSSPTVAVGAVYVGSDDHHLYALRT
jgi:outer membrane protein assembly factor BamB/serine/threonine protein kinase